MSESMLVDSHCHLNFEDFQDRLPEVLARMVDAGVTHALCASVTIETLPDVLRIASEHPNIFASAGVHPDYPDAPPLSVDELVRLADHPKVVAIGETGLDYFRLKGDLEWQRDRFRTHIRAARATGKPLIIHTRAAAEDTLRIMREENAAEVGGVMHCFTETSAVAAAALELNFYISFSGIVTFKTAAALRQTASEVPLERVLVETDSPYLAPVPHRGKVNEPSFVKYVAALISKLKNVSEQHVADVTSKNFFNLFRDARTE